MNVIKPILIACFLGLLRWAFRNRNRVGLRTARRSGPREDDARNARSGCPTRVT